MVSHRPVLTLQGRHDQETGIIRSVKMHFNAVRVFLQNLKAPLSFNVPAYTIKSKLFAFLFNTF